MKNFKICSNDNGWFIENDGKKILGSADKSGQVLIYLKNGNEFKGILDRNSCKENEFCFVSLNGNLRIQDKICVLENGFYEINRTFTNLSAEAISINPVFELCTAFEPNFYLFPCVNYNGNVYGNGNEPKGLTKDGKPWVFSYSRTAIPASSFSENDEFAVGMCTSTYNKESLVSSCSIVKEDNYFKHRIIWPENEGPITYNNRDKYCDAIINELEICPNESFSVKCYFGVAEVEEKNYGWAKVFKNASNMLFKNVEMSLKPEDVWNRGIKFARDVLYVKEDSALSIGLVPKDLSEEKDKDSKFDVEGYKWRHRSGGRYEIGWCGQNGAFSAALIKDYLMNGNKESLEVGIEVLDNWVNNAVSRKGLMAANYNLSFSEEKKFADACNLGWSILSTLNAYEFAKEAKIEKSNWLLYCVKASDFFCEKFDDVKLFGKNYDIVEGTVCGEDGSGGIFIALALVKTYTVTKNEKYLDIAKKAFLGYAERDLANMTCTAGALDSCCVDKETAWPFLKLAIDLFEITNEEVFLKYAKEASDYIQSWTLHFEAIYNENTDFKKYGYSTYGATVVSAQHQHVDPWGGLIACDWFRLYEITKDEKYKNLARATWANAICSISDGSDEVNGFIRPVGGQNEAYFHTNWCFYEGFDGTKRMNDWLVAWPTAFRLITLFSNNNWSKFK